MAEFIKA